MLLQPECIPCILQMAVNAMRRLNLLESPSKELLSDIITNLAHNRFLWDVTSPEIVQEVMTRLVTHTGDSDPFKELKNEQNEKAMELYPWLKSLVEKAEDPLYIATNLAILGNSLDAMKYDRTVGLKELLLRRLRTPIPLNNYLSFRKGLQNCGKLVYIGDNCGEIVFDRVMVETLKEQLNLEIIFIVRSQATLNDATAREAKQIGLQDAVTVVENGIEGPLPGTILARCSKNAREIIEGADLLISKGGGNFDSLTEERGIQNKIYFMLLTKCMPYQRKFMTAINEPALICPISK